jgi:non-ribosomal peptide synthetase component F
LRIFSFDFNKISGKIMIGGGAVGLGYCDDSMNEGKFLKFLPILQPENVSEDSENLGSDFFYDSGDIGRWDLEGNLEFIRRADDQIKIRGHRIELTEITNFLIKYPGVAHVVVVPLSHSEKVSTFF